MTKIMTASKFISQAIKAEGFPSCYVTGCFGAPLTLPGVIERWEDEYPKNKKYDELMCSRADAAKAAGTYCFGWDCINYVKSLLWSWDADGSAEYGGCKYQNFGIPDTTVDGIFDLCTNRSTDFSDIKPGAFLYMSNGGHCGIYIGDGLALEATGSWERKIYRTAVNNLKDKYPNPEYDKRRTWQKWGLLPWIDYEEESTMSLQSKIICPCCGRTLNTEIQLTLKADDLLTTYTVKKNDTPWGIAQKFYGDGTKYYIIMDYNGLARNAYIHEGQQLLIPRI